MKPGDLVQVLGFPGYGVIISYGGAARDEDYYHVLIGGRMMSVYARNMRVISETG